MPTPTWLQRELALIAAEAERRHEHEVESLRHRLQQCETERMQSQLHALQLEAQLQEANAQRQELEGALDDAESEIAQQRLNSDHDKREERTVEAAQLARINELSRELIATRFELAAALGRLPPTATPSASTEVSHLGLDALLSAAARLDLQAADAILNPACVLTRAVGAANAASDDDGAAATSSGLAPTPAASAPAADVSLSPTLGEICQAQRDALSVSLDRALLTVCKPVTSPSALAVTGTRGARAGTTAGSAGSAPSPSLSPTSLKPRGSPAASGKPKRSPLSPRSPAAVSAGAGAAAASAARAHAAAAAAMATAKGVSPPKVADDSSAESSVSSGADGDDAERGGVPEHTSPADEEAEAPGARARSAEAAGALIEALLLRGAQVNAVDETGRTAIHWACERGQPLIAALLVQHHASLEVVDARGRTPLHAAAARGSGTLVELLLRHGADETVEASDGSTAGSLASAAADSGAATTLADCTLRVAGMARRANALYRRGLFGKATTAFEKALEVATGAGASVCSATDVATLHFNCARAAIKEGRHVFALEQATEAVRARPDYANAGMLQAECHMELFDFDAAAAAYRRVASLEPHNSAWIDCAERAETMARATPYEVLGVPDTADAPAIKRAYRVQCLQWHPDKHQKTAEERARASAMFQRVTRAYETLSDELARADLDIRLRADALRAFRAEADLRAGTAGAGMGAGMGAGGRGDFGGVHHAPTVDQILQDAMRAGREFARDFGEATAYDERGCYSERYTHDLDEDLRQPNFGAWRKPSRTSPAWFENDTAV